MRRYPQAAIDTLRTRRLVSEWQAEGLLTDEQSHLLEQETTSNLSTANFFLRLVLFFFTVVCAAAAVGLLFLLLNLPNESARGSFLLIAAALCYGAAEYAVSAARFYRHGIEEALAVCSIAYLSVGLLVASPHHPEVLAASAGALLALWIWYRFELWYALLLAMVAIFAAVFVAHWNLSATAHRLILLALYATALVVIARLRPRDRLDPLTPTWSLAEAFLSLGICLTLNLKLTALDLPGNPLFNSSQSASPYGRLFYWTTWLLLWCLPPLILARGIALKDRFLLAAGTLTALLTLISNKPYLGWPRHTWDPMLLGILLTGTALLLRRWLAQGPDGIRYGFTAAQPSKKQTEWLGTGAAALGLFSPHALTRTPQSDASAPTLDGGASGGAGATRDF